MSRWLIALLVVACGSKPPAAPPPSPPPAEQPVKADPAPLAPSGDPFDARTWTAKLVDPKQREHALEELEQLGDPAAIEPLGKLFLTDRSLRALQVMIAIARPLTPDEAKARFLTAYEDKGRPASWPRALPFLARALADAQPADPRSVDAALKAADALGESQLADATDPLLAMARRPPDKKLVTAHIAAIRALGKLTVAKATVAPALGKLIDADPPRHPRLAASDDDRRALEERYSLHLMITGASINALADVGVATQITPLVLALYRTPELATQLRRALVKAGPGARDTMLEVLAGKHAAVERLIKDKQLERYCWGSQCQTVAPRDYYAALVLGDLRDPRATSALLAALKRPAAPAYYADDLPGPTQHAAILDALRKLGSADIAAPLLAIWNDRKAELATRAAAMETYGFVARGAVNTAELAKIASDNAAPDELRVAAANTLARVSTAKADVAVFLQLAKRYLDAADQKRKEATRFKPAADAADPALAAAKQQLEAAKHAVLAATKDATATADRIRALTQTAKRAEDDFKIAKKKHRDATMPFRQADSAAKAYVGFARFFQTHVARVDVALRCAGKLDCFAATLKLGRDQAAAHAAVYVKDATTWTTEEKLGLVEAEIERAMIELGKAGPAAAPYTDALLDAVAADSRPIRQSILLALPRIAKVPCTTCVTKLDVAITAPQDQARFGDVIFETTLLRHYFAGTP